MNGIKFAGRLGNQLFQYAFGQSLAKKLDTKVFYIFQNTGLNKTIINQYFKLKDFNILKNKLYEFWYVIAYKKKVQDLSNILILSDIEPKVNSIISGFFQSEYFFRNVIDEVKLKFEIKNKYKRKFEKKYSNFFKNNKTIVIHIRLGDYKVQGNELLGGIDLSLPFEYYHNILNMIPNIENYSLLFLSDEIEKIKNEFNIYINANFEENDLIIDFQIIQNADISIISNSTFAWWAAYLSNNKSTIVYAPKYWLGFKVKKEYPTGIMLTNWNWIDVDL